MKFRIFVEKKKQFDFESPKWTKEIQQSIEGLEVKTFIIYDVFGLSMDQLLETPLLKNILIDPITDTFFTSESLKKHSENILSTEYLPGQFDQRADSATQCFYLLGEEKVQIRSGLLFKFSRNLSEEEFNSLTKILVNSVDSQLKNLDVLELPKNKTPEEVQVFEKFNSFNEIELNHFIQEQGLAMDLADVLFVQEYFKKEGRNPTETEIKVLDTYWSDHCRHTTFETELENIQFEGDFSEVIESVFNKYLETRKELNRQNKPITLMDLATICGRYFKAKGMLEDLVVSEEINACTIEVKVDNDGKEEDWLLLFKNETHNHPTEIEPFGGAATCLGGAIRDPLSGRSYVYQAMRVSGAANPLESISETIKGKLPQRKISKEAALGFSSYGNQIGLATTHIAEIFHSGYKAKRMEVGFVMGAVPKDWVRRETPKAGDLVILVGGRTGRDGIGGATGSSKLQDVNSITDLGAEVQKGNPVEERKIQRFFRSPEVTKLIKKCNDFGAGGVSVAIGEICRGVEVNLDEVNVKYSGLNGTELAISESQERMAVVISPDDKDTFLKLAEKENLEAKIVAEATQKERLVMLWKGNKIVDFDREFLDSNGASRKSSATIYSETKNYPFSAKELTPEFLKEQIQDINHASQRGMNRLFDSSIGRTTVLAPMGGKNELTPAEGGAQKIPTDGVTNTISLSSWGFNPKLSSWSPFHGALYAVVDSVAKIVAMGGEWQKIRFSFQEYFEKLKNDPKKWGKPLSALLGAYKAQMEFGTAAIGGKDSMSGTFQEINVPPTLISFAVATTNIQKVTSSEFKGAGNYIYYLKANTNNDNLPDFDELKESYTLVSKEIEKGNIISAKTISESGIAQTVSIMAIGNEVGVKVNTNEDLTLPNFGGLILESNLPIYNPSFIVIGKTNSENTLEFNGIKILISEAIESYTSTFEDLFPTKHGEINNNSDNFSVSKPAIRSEVKIAKPKVFIPIFSGTNCEYDSAKAFRKEGGIVSHEIFKNLTPKHISESVDAFVKQVEESQIIMFPGGFSLGDEPDGSAKYIVSILNNPKIKEAIHLFLERKGLILGICNGFQALIKSGLLPDGKISLRTADSPTLTQNVLGTHLAKLVNVKVTNNNSPWLSSNKVGEHFLIPISHGEGRFYASENELHSLIKNGQIATQYANLEGNLASDDIHNPNGSVLAIEGITDPSGQIYGRMAHAERFEDGLFKNIPNIKYHNIFKNGIDYFK